MSMAWIVAGIVVTVLVVIGSLLFAFGIGMTVVYWVTGLFHATREEPLPGENDDNWSPDQASEV